MAKKDLEIYLNDHLAGSVTALEILHFLLNTQAGTAIEHVLIELHDEITAEQKLLESLMERLQISPSHTRKATAWFAEKLAELKLKVEDPSGALHLLEALEALSIGIAGKAMLWRTLAATAEEIPPLRDVNYDHLIQQAEAQRMRVEGIRQQAARAALGKGPELTGRGST